MAKNELFEYLSKNPDIASQWKAKLGENKQNHAPYFMITPPIKDTSFPFQGNHCQISTSHLSIYDKDFKLNPQLSAYHYTAYFPVKGTIYRVHVFFDTNGRITNPPVLAKQIATGKYQTQDSDELDNGFWVDLANRCVRQYIYPIRDQLTVSFAEKKRQFDELEQQASELSVNPTPDYLQKLQEMLPVVDDLVKLSGDPFYPGIRKFLEGAIEAFNRTQVVKVSAGASASSSLDVPDEADLPAPPTKKKKSSTARIASALANPARKKIDPITLNKRLSNLPGFKRYPEQHIDELIKIWEIFTNEMNFVGSEENYFKWSGIRRLLIKTGSTCLRTLLDEGGEQQLTQASKLPMFYDCLLPMDLSRAIQTNNISSLSFMLRTANLANDVLLNFGEETYPSLAVACFKLDKWDCLMEILKLDPLAGCDLDSAGVPIAHQILSDHHHPLYYSFIYLLEDSNEKLKIAFYSTLLTVLPKTVTQDQRDLYSKELEYSKLKNRQLKSEQYVAATTQGKFRSVVQSIDSALEKRFTRIRHHPKFIDALCCHMRAEFDFVALLNVRDRKYYLMADRENDKQSLKSPDFDAHLLAMTDAELLENQILVVTEDINDTNKAINALRTNQAQPAHRRRPFKVYGKG